MSQQAEVFCPNCKGGNPATATVCQWCSQPLPVSNSGQSEMRYTPPPQAPQPAQQVVVEKKRSRLPLILGLIFVCLALAIGASLGAPKQPAAPAVTSSATNTVAVAQAAPTNTTGEAAPPAPEPSATTVVEAPSATNDLGVGSTGESDGIRITLNEVRHDTEGIIAPKEGHEFLVLNITVENASGKDYTFSSLLTSSVKDDTGQKYSNAFGAKTAKAPDGAVAQGDKVRGELAYEIPTTARGLVFMYEPFLGKTSLRFKLDR